MLNPKCVCLFVCVSALYKRKRLELSTPNLVHKGCLLKQMKKNLEKASHFESIKNKIKLLIYNRIANTKLHYVEKTSLVSKIG